MQVKRDTLNTFHDMTRLVNIVILCENVVLWIIVQFMEVSAIFSFTAD